MRVGSDTSFAQISANIFYNQELELLKLGGVMTCGSKSALCRVHAVLNVCAECPFTEMGCLQFGRRNIQSSMETFGQSLKLN